MRCDVAALHSDEFSDRLAFAGDELVGAAGNNSRSGPVGLMVAAIGFARDYEILQRVLVLDSSVEDLTGVGVEERLYVYLTLGACPDDEPNAALERLGFRKPSPGQWLRRAEVDLALRCDISIPIALPDFAAAAPVTAREAVLEVRRYFPLVAASINTQLEGLAPLLPRLL